MAIGVKGETATLPFVRKDPTPTSWTNEIKFTLSATGLFTRMENCPVRKIHDIRLRFEAQGWKEIYPFNFSFTTGWGDPGVQMEEKPILGPGHSFGGAYLVSTAGLLTVPVHLPDEMVKYIEACEPNLSKGDYLAVKFDVLAKKGDKWWFVDPRLGVRR